MTTITEKLNFPSLQEQMISSEKSYQKALLNDEQFSVLKGFKNDLKALISELEKMQYPDVLITQHQVPGSN